MKFILQEDKFILNEKFLLNERFVLNEDILLEAQATAKQLVIDLTKLNTLLPELLKYLPTGVNAAFVEGSVLEGTTLDIINDIKTGCSNVLELLNKNPSFQETIKKIHEKVLDTEATYSDEEIKVLQPLCYQIASDGNSVKDRLKSLKNQKGDFGEQLTTLQERLPKLQASIEELYKLINLKDGDPEDERPVDDKPENEPITYKLNKTNLELEIGQTFKLEVTSEPKKDISADKIKFESTTPAIVKVAKSGLLKAFKAGAATIKVTIDKVELNCAVVVKAKKDKPKKEPIKTTDGIDWKTKLASAIDKDTVIEEFIYTTWPEYAQAQEVIKIKAALLQECEHYGFLTTGEKLNPFITFISTVYLKNDYGVKPELYNVIHNLVASNVLAGKDLASKGEMGHGNLVFCKALYKLDAGAIKLYIKKQHNLLKAAKRPDTFESNAEMAFNILYKVATVVQGKDARNATDMQLRSMAEIEQLEARWIGEVSDTAEEPKNKVATNAELIKQIDTTEDAINVLIAIAIKFSTSDEITKAVKGCTEAKQRMSKSFTIAETQALVAKVERLYKLTAINASQALKLVKSILESDKFNLTKE